MESWGVSTGPKHDPATADTWRAAADSAMAIVASALTDAPFGPATEAIQDYQDTLVAVEALLIAQRKKAGHSDRATEGVIKDSGRVSKSEAKRRTKRADVVQKNPALATRLTNGTLSMEKVDLLADASSRTEGAAATDADLIDNISNANPDQAKSIVRKFVDDHTDQGDRDSRYAWQRKRRRVYKTRTSAGMSALIMEGDDESIETAFKKIRRRADTMYRDDGGRDVGKDKHDRSFEQRLYDAAFAHFAGAPTNTPASPASSTRPMMVFTGRLSDITSDPDRQLEWECELIGSGRLPMPVAEYFRCISDHAAHLVSGTGEVLWHGRTKRMVTSGQWLALTVRDSGCVLCGVDHAACEAHHLKPWNAPVKGETNIDELALVCADCHHRIHDNRLTLYLDYTDRTWRLRAATPNEIAPDGRRPQLERTKTTASRSRDPSGSRLAASTELVNAT